MRRINGGAWAASIGVAFLCLSLAHAPKADAQGYTPPANSALPPPPPAFSGPNPNAESYGFPKPTVEKPSSMWNPFEGAANAIRGAFTPAPSQQYPRITEGDPTALRTEAPALGLEVHLQAARLAMTNRRIPEAKHHFEAVLGLDAKHLESLISLARIASLSGDFPRAAKQYVVAIQAHPNVAAVHNDFGVAAEKANRRDIAISAFEYAVKLDGEKTLYRNNFARALVDAGRYQEALQQLVATHPPAAAHYNFAYLLSEKGADDQAIFHLRQALRLSREFPEAQQLLNKLTGKQQVLQTSQFGPPLHHRTNPQFTRVPPPAGAPGYRVPPQQPVRTARQPAPYSPRPSVEDTMFRPRAGQPVYMPPAAPRF